MELNITWERAGKVWLAFLWRNILVMIGAIIVSMIIGAIVGFIMALLGMSKGIPFVSGIIGFIIGITCSVIPIKMIIGKDFGEFRLVLLSTEIDIKPLN